MTTPPNRIPRDVLDAVLGSPASAQGGVPERIVDLSCQRRDCQREGIPELGRLCPSHFTAWYAARPVPEPTLYETVRAEWTGLAPTEITAALAHLCDGQEPRIHREGNLVWIVGAVNEEPSRSPLNGNHRDALRKHMAGLPRLAIVERFVAAHPEWLPPTAPAAPSARTVLPPASRADGMGDGMGDGIPHGLPHAIGEHGDGDGDGKGDGYGRSTKGAARGAAGPKAKKPPRATYPWMGEIRALWRARYGGAEPKQLAPALAPLVTEHGAEEVARRFRIYTDRTEHQYVSASRFVATWGGWDGSATAVETPAALDRAADALKARVDAELNDDDRNLFVALRRPAA